MSKRILSLLLTAALLSASLTFSSLAAGPVVKRPAFVAGEQFMMAIRADGSLWAWGRNWNGQMGVGVISAYPKYDEYALPVKVPLDNVVAVDARRHAMAITSDGSLYTWGENEEAQLGNGTMKDSATPQKVLDHVVSTGLSSHASAAVTEDGSLWMWGRQSYIMMRVPADTVYDRSAYITRPKKVMDGVAAIALNDVDFRILKTDGTLWGCGWNNRGQMGVGPGGEWTYYEPVKLMDHITAVSVGANHTAAIDEDGVLWAWGPSACTPVDQPDAPPREIPTKIMENVTAVQCFMDGTLALKEDGTLWYAGGNTYGQAGDGTVTPCWTPKKIMDGVAAVSAKYGNVAALKTDGTFWTWGQNDYGQIGNGTRTAYLGRAEQLQLTPVQILNDVRFPIEEQLNPDKPPSSWAENDVEQAVRLGLVPATLQDQYQTPITRAEFCALAVRLIERRTGAVLPMSAAFSDTKDPNVQKLAALGVVDGVGGGRFNPDGAISREQAAKMLALTGRYLGMEEKSSELSFTDRGKISAWATAYVSHIYASDIMRGKPGPTFDPQGKYTREESVVTLLRLNHALDA